MNPVSQPTAKVSPDRSAPNRSAPNQTALGQTALGQTALSNSDEQRLAEVLDEYVQALERGESPDIAALAADCPEVAGVLPEYLEGVRAIHEALAPAPTPESEDSSSAEPPSLQQLGDYQLVREIGRGGMGVVYEAQQVSLNRRVALKVLPFAAVLDERQTARFRTEAQAAAALHHPNIVPVFAVGQERGVHFYAMQYVEGQSLGEAMQQLSQLSLNDQQPSNQQLSDHQAPPTRAVTQTTTLDGRQPASALSTTRSIRESAYVRTVAQLGVQAAEALEHAHQYGVIHRDIKPTNLLVDRSGKLWVTDFGLARMQTEMGVTQTGDVVGTLRYMSPEQARGRNDLIDGRTDIYALGATLYELLTLTPAHPGDEPHAITQRIESTDPTPPRRFNPSMPIDLETIVLRALEKSREDRYATAQELADDLRRFLDGRPTAARRPGLVERAGKWLARRRAAALGVAAALVIVTIVSAASAVLVVAAGRQTAAALEESQHNLALAQSHYRQARTAVDHFGSDLADRLAELPGADRLRHELLTDTLSYYQAFLQSAEQDADLRDDLADTHFKSGAIAHRLGNLAAARDSYAQAVAIWRESLRSEKSRLNKDATPDDRHRPRIALGLRSLAAVESELEQHDLASAHFAESIALATAAVAGHPDRASSASALANTLVSHGAALRRAGKPRRGVDEIRSAIEWYRRALELAPDRSVDLRSLAVAHSNLSDALRATDPVVARSSSEQAVAALRRLVNEQPAETSRHADLAMALNNLAALDGAAGDWGRAAVGYRQAVNEIQCVVHREPLLPRSRRELAITLSNLALALARTGDHAGTNRAFHQANQVLDELVADFPNQPVYAASLAALANNRGVALQVAGREEESLAAFAEAVRLHDQIVATAPTARPTADQALRNYAAALLRAGREDEFEVVNAKRMAFTLPIDPQDAEPTTTTP